MKKRNNASRQYVICVDNSDYPVSLDLHKIYEVMPDERAAEDDCLRIIDESGEDYLYSSERFIPVDLPKRVQESMSRVREAAAIAETPKRLARSKREAPRTAKAQNRHRTARN